MSFECPAQGPNCTNCVMIGKIAFELAYREKNSNRNAMQAHILAEHSNVGALIEKQPDIDAVGCHTRQYRARNIGQKLGHLRGSRA